MIQKLIGLYPNAKTTANPERITVEDFLEKIKCGEWQDQVLKLRAAKEQGKAKETIENLKQRLPLVTASGLFTERTDKTLEVHSGYLCIDLDQATVDAYGGVNAVKESLVQDSLFHSLFISCSGTGVCGLVRINPKAHFESFLFMDEHLYTKYGLNMDVKCKNTSRARFASYDPDLYHNPDAQLCPVKPTPVKDRHRVRRYYFNNEDFERIISDINAQELDLTYDYQTWLYTGFALCDKFGEAGREYFHDISKFHHDYDYDKTDAKYTHLLNTTEHKITINWFYYLVEKNGLKPYGKATEDFLQQSLAEQRAYDAGLLDERPLSAVTLAQIDIKSADTGIQIRDFLHKAYDIKKNEMTRALEVNGELLDDELLNTIYILCRSVIDKINSRDLVFYVMSSRFTPRYHPFKDYMKRYDENAPEEPYGHIDALIATIDIHHPQMALFIKKWLVSIIGSAHGHHSPLMLILQGPQNCGKTSWFRNLLPEPLMRYYAESKLVEGKDSQILMSKKLLILDDEMSGKNKQEESSLKSTLSMQTMDLRVPHGRTAETMLRIAVLCGTANEDELLSDSNGNRRLIPVGITKVDFKAYNELDKSLLFYEAYLEYLNGYNYELNGEDIKLLNEITTKFNRSVPEEELITKYFMLPEDAPGTPIEHMSCSDIFSILKDGSRIPLTTKAVGQYLKKLGFQQKHKKIGKTTIRQYQVVRISEFDDLNDIL